MARRHGQNGRLYVDVSSAGNAAAIPVATLNSWSITFTTDKVEVTAFEDTNKTYVSGKPDVQGTYAGFLDDGVDQLYHAATGGQGRKFYLYPDRSNSATKYWFGEAIFDQQVQGSVSGAVEVSGSFAASNAVSRQWT